ACPHHGFSELHQLDTFYNALNVNDQDSLNSVAGGNFLDKMPADCLKIIESKSKVRQTRAKAVVAKVSSNSSTPTVSTNVAELKDMGQSTQNQCQGTQNQLQTVQNQLANLTDMMAKFMSANTASSSGSGTLPGNTVTNPKEDLKGITIRSGVAYQGPNTPTPSKVAKQGTKVTKDQVQTSNPQSTAPVQPTVTQSEPETLVSEPVVAPVSAPMPNLKLLIPYPSRRDTERCQKLSEMARTPMNEHCLAVILKKLPKKLGDPKKFLIPCEFPRMDEYLALADLGASINLMPLFVWKGLSLPELTPTCMTLELADRTKSKPVGIAKDVKTNLALIDVHKGELTLRIKNEAITYNLDQTFRYSANYDQMTANKIDVTDEACEEYSQEVLGFSDVTASGSPTPSDDPIVSTTSLALTPFGDSDFLLFEEADAFLGLVDDPDSPELDPSYYDPKGDILSLKVILNSDPSPPLPNHEQFVPLFKEELKACEAKTIKSSIDEHPEIAELIENFNGMSIEIRKKEKLLQLEQWAYLSTHPSKRLTSFCYDDDDEDYTSTITPDEPVLSTEDPDNSLSMGDEHLDTIPTTKSDEFIKSGVENLIPIPSESEGIPEHMCDVPSHDNSPPLDVSKDQFEDFSESKGEFSSTDDDYFSFDKIDYIEASHPDYALVSSEVMEIVIPEVRGIKASNDNTIPFFDPIISGTSPNLTPSGESDFFLKVDAFLAVEDEPTSSQFSKSYLDLEGDMLLLEAFINDDHSSDFKTNNDQSCSDEDVLEKIISKPLSEEEIIPMESLRTHDSSLPISSKIDSLLDEFVGELTLIKSIPPGIDGTDCDFEEDIRLIEKLLYDNSSPRPPEEFVSANYDAKIKSFSPSPVLVKDSDSLMEEINLFCTPDYPMPPGIKDKDYDSERDILIPKDLPSNNTLSFAEKESLHFDIPLFSRPPAKPLDGDTGILNIKMMGDISDQKDFMHKLMITLALH
nr:hypothetical protein [Tanacetum cinerariifolium]